jgi:type IV pilus assembly protein PilA
MARKQVGFSLIELLIVVAIILVIAAIAIPNFLASRMAANESSAVQETRAITTAQVAYQTEYGMGYAANLSSLGGSGTVASSTNALLIDSVLSSGSKSGYLFTYTPGVADGNGNYVSYSINANPKILGGTGRRFFYADQSVLIRYNYTAPATVTDPSLQ